VIDCLFSHFSRDRRIGVFSPAALSSAVLLLLPQASAFALRGIELLLGGGSFRLDFFWCVFSRLSRPLQLLKKAKQTRQNTGKQAFRTQKRSLVSHPPPPHRIRKTKHAGVLARAFFYCETRRLHYGEHVGACGRGGQPATCNGRVSQHRGYSGSAFAVVAIVVVLLRGSTDGRRGRTGSSVNVTRTR